MEYDIFGGIITAGDGSIIAVAGLCGAGKRGGCEVRLAALKALDFTGLDYIAIDRHLAERLQEIYCRDGYIVGASVNVPSAQALPRTGGVLGSPREPVVSSDSQMEWSEEGFWIYSQPGGPGFSVAASQAQAEKVLADFRLAAPSGDREADCLEECFAREGISTYVIICDGSGTEAKGMAVAVNGEKNLRLVN